MTIIEEFEQEQIAKLTADGSPPWFAPGDTLRVKVKVVEGTRERVQAFEGVCIARRNRGLNSSFTVRKISYGEGVERVFPLYSPSIDGIEVVRRGDVRRAKLYYLRVAARQERAHLGEDRRLRRQGDGDGARNGRAGKAGRRSGSQAGGPSRAGVSCRRTPAGYRRNGG